MSPTQVFPGQEFVCECFPLVVASACSAVHLFVVVVNSAVLLDPLVKVGLV